MLEHPKKNSISKIPQSSILAQTLISGKISLLIILSPFLFRYTLADVLMI